MSVDFQRGGVILGDTEPYGTAAQLLIPCYRPRQKLYPAAAAAKFALQVEQGYPAVACVLTALGVEVQKPRVLVVHIRMADGFTVRCVMAAGAFKIGVLVIAAQIPVRCAPCVRVAGGVVFALGARVNILVSQRRSRQVGQKLRC